MSATITIKKNGSIVIEGEFTMQDVNGNQYGLGGRERISLCRCGASANKPFCDGTHRSCGFEHDGAARDLPALPIETRTA